MAIKMEDLPPWAQQQALNKMQAEARRKPASPFPVQQQNQESGNKYHNERTTRTLDSGDVVDFDSKKEARRFDILYPLFKAGKIRELKLQPQFTLQEAYTTPEGKRVRAIRYQADFSYERPTAPDATGTVRWLPVVEDVKSEATKTRVYSIKKKLMREKFGVDVTEV